MISSELEEIIEGSNTVFILKDGRVAILCKQHDFLSWRREARESESNYYNCRYYSCPDCWALFIRAPLSFAPLCGIHVVIRLAKAHDTLLSPILSLSPNFYDVKRVFNNPTEKWIKDFVWARAVQVNVYLVKQPYRLERRAPSLNCVCSCTKHTLLQSVSI